MPQQFFQGQEIFPGQSFITDPVNMTGFLVNSQGKRFRKRFQTGQQPDNTFFASEFGTPPISGPEEQAGGGLESALQDFQTRPGFGPAGFDANVGSPAQPQPLTVAQVGPRPGVVPGLQNSLGLAGQLQPPPTTPRRVQRSFTEGLTAPGLGVGNRAIGNLLETLFGRF